MRSVCGACLSVGSVLRVRELVGVWVAVVLVGCGSAGGGDGPGVSAVSEDRSAAPSYKGRLSTASAVDALECDGRKPFKTFRGSYDDGLATVQSSAESAFDNYIQESSIGYTVPRSGYRVERKDNAGALLSYDVRGRTKVAVFVADGIHDWNDDDGWGVVAWAQCDPAELPPEVTEDLDIGVWEDAMGRRIPVSRVQSYQGPEHCSWSHIRFLLIGPEKRADRYVRDTKNEFSGLLHGRFERITDLPAGATSTGYRRNERRLWLAHDKLSAYLVAEADPRNIERWPAERKPIRCA